MSNVLKFPKIVKEQEPPKKKMLTNMEYPKGTGVTIRLGMPMAVRYVGNTSHPIFDPTLFGSHYTE